jgi:uncharacterized protein involved in type VI secretion and phage assembly
MKKLNSVHTEIKVDGQECDWTYLNLDQSMCGHHVFEIGVSYRTKENSVWRIRVDKIFRTTLGKPVSVRMTHIASGQTNEFEGVVTDMEAAGLDGDEGTIILRGGSPTILLDRNASMGSFVDCTLHNVVAGIIKQTAIKISIENKPQTDQIIPYIARYKETGFAFLSRILAAYGEWFYYNGKKLVVGRPDTQEPRKLTFDLELTEVRSMAGMRNLNTAYYDYNPAGNSYYERECTRIDHASLPMQDAKTASDPVYSTQTKLPMERAILDDSDMAAAVKVKQGREYVKTSRFTARCNSCAVHVGDIAEIHLPQTLKNVFFKDLGSFLVISVSHSVKREDGYENTFTGISGATKTLPDDHIVMPQAFPELAVVTDSNDPKHQGRVKVRLLWQPEGESTNWIRVQTPDAGKSDTVAGNRGFVFIPEVEDQVMVGFEQGDPSRPYVMGSLFHRDNSTGAAGKNTMRTIATPSGLTIEFNDDTKGDWGITVKDTEGNIIHVNTKDKSVEISAPDKISISSKEINICGSDSVNISSEKLISNDCKKEIIIHAAENASIEGESSVSIAGASINENGENITLTASQNADVKGMMVNMEATMAGSVKGMPLNLNC